MEDLCAPLERFEHVPDMAMGSRPKYYVMFDMRPRKLINGLRINVQSIKLPDERISDAILNCSKSVKHLKDRLKRSVAVTGASLDIEAIAQQSKNLMICADLANKKKHGGSDNRSGIDPTLGLVNFDLSRSGPCELFYDGGKRDKELLVTNPVPIFYRVDVETCQGAVVGDALQIIRNAFDDWLPCIKQLGILAGSDGESRRLSDLLL